MRVYVGLSGNNRNKYIFCTTKSSEPLKSLKTSRVPYQSSSVKFCQHLSHEPVPLKYQMIKNCLPCEGCARCFEQFLPGCRQWFPPSPDTLHKGTFLPVMWIIELDPLLNSKPTDGRHNAFNKAYTHRKALKEKRKK